MSPAGLEDFRLTGSRPVSIAIPERSNGSFRSTNNTTTATPPPTTATATNEMVFSSASTSSSSSSSSNNSMYCKDTKIEVQEEYDSSTENNDDTNNNPANSREPGSLKSLIYWIYYRATSTASPSPTNTNDYHPVIEFAPDRMFNTPSETLKALAVLGRELVVNQSPVSTLLGGIQGGILLSLGGMLALTCGGGFFDLPKASEGEEGGGGHQPLPIASRIAMGAVFPVGLIMLVSFGAQLFTGNVMNMLVAVFTRQISPINLIGNWGLVFVGNFLGSLIVAYFLGYLSKLHTVDPYLSFILTLTQEKVALEWTAQLWRGIGCNILVCLALILNATARDFGSKMLGMWFPVFAFVVMGYEHCVADMMFVPYGMMLGAKITVGEFLWNNLVPSTLGDILGGGLLVALIMWLLNRK
ncbi:hypothetical protein H4219_004571 [Mycoemilia scoparia]|uniref:Formate/nitrite transporter n=1 Tax=Mycoemilia scoparia TaxID=417184 RepID=A0A9W8DLA4_9FUNG|nr:hypothetical protein H4219_004571 [Mycoemilia scoparia]